MLGRLCSICGVFIFIVVVVVVVLRRRRRRTHPETTIAKEFPFFQIRHRRGTSVIKTLFHFRQLVQVPGDVVVAIPTPGATTATLRPVKDLAEAFSRIGLKEGSSQGSCLFGYLSQGLGVADHVVAAVA